jgi:hypothetical protein
VVRVVVKGLVGREVRVKELMVKGFARGAVEVEGIQENLEVV